MNIPIYDKHSYKYSNKQTQQLIFSNLKATILTLNRHVNAKCESGGITKRNILTKLSRNNGIQYKDSIFWEFVKLCLITAFYNRNAKL